MRSYLLHKYRKNIGQQKIGTHHQRPFFIMSASIKIQYFFSVFGSSGPRLNIFTDSFLKNSLVGIENETMDSAVTACEVPLHSFSEQ